jgi:hypothetical protein
MASPKTSLYGESVLIEGTVTDISAGAKQNEQAARFPNGVPAVSDDSMAAWMEYVYQQQPMPTNTTGVPISIDVLDSNGNCRNIGVATSDENGFFSFAWKPDIPGKYTVFASFLGSESYYGSRAETAFTVDEAVVTPAPEYPQPIDNTMTIAGMGSAILATIVVGFIVLYLMLRKR